MKNDTTKKMHEKLGCKGCKFCNEKWLYKSPCCDFPCQIAVDSKGKCQTRRDR